MPPDSRRMIRADGTFCSGRSRAGGKSQLVFLALRRVDFSPEANLLQPHHHPRAHCHWDYRRWTSWRRRQVVAMSRSVTSPTARLLQNSRLFSLPRPLPQPALELATSTGQYRSSDTATLPYPVLQSIATPASSHHRGDWGLKRALPTRKTKHHSNPAIRITAVDNAAHITSFGSAGDHVQTQLKWKEMGVPLTVKETRSRMSDPKSNLSVYEEQFDSTDREALKQAPISDGQPRRRWQEPAQPLKRWKYGGPWMAGMSEGEFELYVMTRVAERKEEFREFMIDRIVDRQVREQERLLREQGETSKLGRYRREEMRRAVVEDYGEEEKRLRYDHAKLRLGSELTTAICEFLDLPGVNDAEPEGRLLAKTPDLNFQIDNYTAESTEPPSTHPGAGLSHLRSNAIMENHPLYGPQVHREPVLARVLRARSSAQGTMSQAKIGVGGIVTQDPQAASGQQRRDLNSMNQEPDNRWLAAQDMTGALDADLEGGNKIYVQPERAYIDADGRIGLDVLRGDKEAVFVKRNKSEEIQTIHDARGASMRSTIPMAPPGTSGNANFGYGLQGDRLPPRPAPRPAVSGFDAELGRKPGQGPMEPKDAINQIRDLASGFRGGRRSPPSGQR